MSNRTVTRHDLYEGMAIMRGKEVIYITDVYHRDDETVIQGSFSNPYSYGGLSVILRNEDVVRLA